MHILSPANGVLFHALYSALAGLGTETARLHKAYLSELRAFGTRQYAVMTT